MKVTLVGKKSGIAKTSGKPYCFAYINHPDNGVVGLSAENLYLSAEIVNADELKVGSVYDVQTNLKGYVLSFEPVK